jgi:elongation factor Tu
MSSSDLRVDQGRRFVYDYLLLSQLTEASTGGRYTPFMAGYRPQLFLRTADVTVSLSFPDETPDSAEKMVGCPTVPSKYYLTSEKIMPGDNVEMVCDLVFDLAMDVGSRLVSITLSRTQN